MVTHIYSLEQQNTLDDNCYMMDEILVRVVAH